jgi:hypothetical protein
MIIKTLSRAPIDRPLLASSSMCKKASSMQIDHICTTPPRFICRHASEYCWALERSHPRSEIRHDRSV